MLVYRRVKQYKDQLGVSPTHDASEMIFFSSFFMKGPRNKNLHELHGPSGPGIPPKDPY